MATSSSSSNVRSRASKCGDRAFGALGEDWRLALHLQPLQVALNAP